jgi:hypothetical protein
MNRKAQGGRHGDISDEGTWNDWSEGRWSGGDMDLFDIVQCEMARFHCHGCVVIDVRGFV